MCVSATNKPSPPPNVLHPAGHAVNTITKKVEANEETDMCIPTESPLSIDNQDYKDCSVVSVSTTKKPSPPPNVLQRLHVARHVVNGDGNCLYHAIAYQARFIEHDCHGDTFIAQQLRKMALNCMQKYPTVRLEEGITMLQWKKK